MHKTVLAAACVVAAIALGSCGSDGSGTSTPTTPTAPTRIIGLSGNLAFGNVLLGENATTTLTIANTGTSTLTVSGMTVTSPLGSIFGATWTSGTIAAAGSQRVTIQFVPAAAQTYSGTLTVNGDQTSGANTISISGTGSAPPSIYSLCGTARKSTNREGVSGVRIEFLDGVNGGKNATTDNGGSYCINQVSAGGFRVRGSRSGYDSLDQSVTISANTTLDFFLKETGTTPAPTPPPSTCCRICTTGKPCGDSCISKDDTCHVGSGCACQGIGVSGGLNGAMPPLDYTPVPLPSLRRQ